MTGPMQIRDQWVGQLRPADRLALTAVAELAQRIGAAGFEFGWDKPHSPYEFRKWWTVIELSDGSAVASARTRFPSQACDEVAASLINQSVCPGCGKLSFTQARPLRVPSFLEMRIQFEGICRWSRHGGERWERGCGNSAPAGSAREKIASELVALRVIPSGVINLVRAGSITQEQLAAALPDFGTLTADLVKRINGGDFHDDVF